MIRTRPLPSVTNRLKTTNSPLSFGGGMNNTDPEVQLGRNEVAAGLNMFFDREGGSYNRNGCQVKGTFLGSTTGILGLFNFVNRAGTQEMLAVYDTGIYRDVSEVWTLLTGASVTTNLKAEGVYYSETDKFYITNGTDNVVVYTSGATATTDASFKKGMWIESFDGRLVTGGVATQEDYLWVTDLGVDTFSANNYQRAEGKLLAGKAINQQLLLVWSDRKLYKVPGLKTTPSAAGPEAFYIVAEVGLVGTRAVTVLDSVAYFIGKDSQNTIDLFASEGQKIYRFGSPKVKDYLSNLVSGSLANTVLTNDGRYVRIATTPSGATTNTREYIFDTLTKKWQSEFQPQFPISCYAISNVSGANIVFAGNQSFGLVEKFNTGRYDEIIDQSNTTGQDTDESIASSTSTRVSQGFKLSHVATLSRYITGGAMLLKKVSGTTTELTVRIETNSADKPTGTLADTNATTTIDALTATSYAWTKFTFTTPFLSSGTTQYHLVSQHTTEGTGDSIYAWGSDSSSPTYASGATSNYASGAWTADSTTDCLFVLFIEEHIESFITQTSDLDDALYPKKPQQVIIEGESETGITARLGIGTEGKDSTFDEADINLSGKVAKWSSNSTETTAGRLVWASNSEETSSNSIKWSSSNSIYSVVVFPSSYIPHSRYLTYRFYYKGIGEFRINKYIPYYEVIPSAV